MRPPTTDHADSAPSFFGRRLPALIVSRLMEYLAWKGSIGFDVVGQGQWTFEFGSDDPVVEGLRRDADLILRFSGAAFDAFVGGTLDAATAVAKGDVTAKGDLRLLDAFGRLLDPRANSLGWEFHPADGG